MMVKKVHFVNFTPLEICSIYKFMIFYYKLIIYTKVCTSLLNILIETNMCQQIVKK